MNPDSRLCLASWSARIEADPEPVLLARLLQKFVCQGATIQTLHYEHDLARADACVRIDIMFLAVSSRAELLAKQWRTIVPVRSVELRTATETPRMRVDTKKPPAFGGRLEAGGTKPDYGA